MCDRSKTSRAVSQINFIEFVVTPIYAQVGPASQRCCILSASLLWALHPIGCCITCASLLWAPHPIGCCIITASLCGR